MSEPELNELGELPELDKAFHHCLNQGLQNLRINRMSELEFSEFKNLSNNYAFC